MPYLAGQIAIILLPVALLFFALGYWSRGFLGRGSASAPVSAGLGSELRSQDDDMRAPAPVVKDEKPVEEKKEAVVVEEVKTEESKEKTEPAGTSKKTATGEADDFTRIKGIGSATARKLHELGVQTYAQLAEWPESEAVKAGYADRLKKHKWREQAAGMD